MYRSAAQCAVPGLGSRAPLGVPLAIRWPHCAVCGWSQAAPAQGVCAEGTWRAWVGHTAHESQCLGEAVYWEPEQGDTHSDWEKSAGGLPGGGGMWTVPRTGWSILGGRSGERSLHVEAEWWVTEQKLGLSGPAGDKCVYEGDTWPHPPGTVHLGRPALAPEGGRSLGLGRVQPRYVWESCRILPPPPAWIWGPPGPRATGTAWWGASCWRQPGLG